MSRLGLLLLVIACGHAFGQERTDSIVARIPDGKADSLLRVSSKYRSLDSLRVLQWSDTLNQRVHKQFRIDSIGLLRSREFSVPGVDTYGGHLDSLKRKRQAMLHEIQSKKKHLNDAISKRYEDWNKTVREKSKADSLLTTGVFGKFQTSSINPRLPASVPDLDLPQIPTLNANDFSNLKLSPEVSRIGGDWSMPTDSQIKQWNPGIPDITKDLGLPAAKLNALKDPSSMAEQAANSVDGVQQLNSQVGQAQQLTSSNEAIKTAEAMKDPEALLPKAVDHFAGKEVVLQAAMEQMAKYKEKYESLQDLSKVKKQSWLPRNGLKGVPFEKRFRLGFHVGYQSVRDTIRLDLFPNASYRISGRFEAGFGAIYRLNITTRTVGIDQSHPVWGTAAFVVCKTFKSVYLRIEADGYSFAKQSDADGSTYRDWRWNFLSGVQSNFNLGGRWTGNVQMLYNFDKSIKDAFPEALTMRVGVQYRLKDNRNK